MNFLDTTIASQLSQIVWTNVYGVGRSILAMATLLTLLTNDVYVLFRPFASGPDTCINCIGFAKFAVFCLLPLGLAKWASIVILSLVVVGIYPRITGLLHCWVTTSFMATAVLVDGGDQVATVLSMLLLPITLTDNRKWIWDPFVKSRLNSPLYAKTKLLIANSTYLIIRLQVCLIYFEACVGKFRSAEWANGTSLYYWFANHQFGVSARAMHLLIPLLSNSIIIVTLTWGVMIFEGLLFLGICINRKYWSYLLAGGLLFHLLIVFVHGLPTFFLSMASALVFYLRPPDKLFSFPARIRQFIDLKRSIRPLMPKRAN